MTDIRRWQSYVEPGDDLESGGGASPTKRISRNFDSAMEHDEEYSQLPENTLTRNLGLDLIVVVAKVIDLLIISFGVPYLATFFIFFNVKPGLAYKLYFIS